MPTSKQITGRRGEDLATHYLRKQGCEIHARNWLCKGGELDIVAHDGEEWVFVEVRTRHAPDTNSALESFTPAKQASLLTAVQAFRDEHDLNEQPWRLDLIVIAMQRAGHTIEVVRDAIGW